MVTPARFCIRCAAPLSPGVEADGGERLRCTASDCGWVFYDNPVPVVAGIVEQGENVILVRSRGWGEGMFGLVTGFLERGESPEKAILREVYEELSLRGDVAAFVGMYPFEAMNQLLLVYHVSVEPGEVTLCDELVAWRAVPAARLRPWPFGTGPGVADWLARRQLRGSE